MFFILFLLGVCQASRLESYIRTIECNIEVVTDLTSVSFDQPFILRRGKEHLNTIQEEMNIDKLLSSIGDKIVGVDYPGPEPPPSPAWKEITMREYLDTILPLENMSLAEALLSNKRMVHLWGPSDACNRFSPDCDDPFSTRFVPHHVYPMYKCPWEGAKDILWGLAGKYTGLPFHSHGWVSNEVIYGKKLWMVYEPEVRYHTYNYTTLDILHDMMEYIEDRDFRFPKMCILEEGDVINIPSFWEHLSFNLETTMMVGCAYEFF